MSWLATVALALLHALYRLVLAFKSLSWSRRRDPLPLLAKRSNLPSHLALILVSNQEADEEANEKYMLNSVEKVAGWCQKVGIRRLTVYDREGRIANCALDIRGRVLPPTEVKEAEDSAVECDIQYPPTPPPSDDSDSRPLSPLSSPSTPKLSVTTIRVPTDSPKPKRRTSVGRSSVKRRRVPRNDEKPAESPFTLHILSYKSGKPAIAAAATLYLRDVSASKSSRSAPHTYLGPSIQELSNVLEGEHGFPSPDLTIVHRKPPTRQSRPPVQFNDFPPWQLRLTEIYWEPYPRTASWWSRNSSATNIQSIQEAEFRRALDEFACAEMRLGK